MFYFSDPTPFLNPLYKSDSNLIGNEIYSK